jgi:hypothetical protein
VGGRARALARLARLPRPAPARRRRPLQAARPQATAAAARDVPQPAAGARGDPRLGWRGQAFVAQFGDQAPVVGKVLGPVGFKVVRVDVVTGVVDDFAVNPGPTNGPASALGSGGLERPIAARFDPAGDALYVVDFGVLTMSSAGSTPHAGTGVLWRITRTS